jgi:foldase protein PrsA
MKLREMNRPILRLCKKGAVLGLLLVFATTTITGCSIAGKKVFVASGSGFHTVFKIGEYACSQKEAKMYLANYKNIYGVVNGNSLWTEEYDTENMEDSVKDAVLQHLTKVYALNQYASDKGITLDSTEKSKIKSAAEEYYDSLTDAEKSYTKASKSDIQGMYERYAIAEKVYTSLMSQVDNDVSEDEARIMDAYVFYVSSESKAEEAEAALNAGTDFTTVAATYNESKTAVETSFGRDTYPSEVEDVAFQLEDGETAYKIEGSDGNYYFIKCISKYDEELSELNKQNVIEKRQTQVMEDIVADLDATYYSDLNQSLWNRIEIPLEDDVQTDSFFSVLDNYLHYNE